MVGLVPAIHVLTTSEQDMAAGHLARPQRRKTWMVATTATMTGKGLMERDCLRPIVLKKSAAILRTSPVGPSVEI
jgi:hypothetical protein